ncbi:MAG: hypothetical protein KDE58_21380 [Caldilineaceae bacterium]|nr:hypothetical protein [Caldilineaceae bacterium]
MSLSIRHPAEFIPLNILREKLHKSLLFVVLNTPAYAIVLIFASAMRCTFYQGTAKMTAKFVISSESGAIFVTAAQLQWRHEQRTKNSAETIDKTTVHSSFSKGYPTMLNKNDFALEQLEDRLEMFCVYVPYVGTCYKKVWFVTIPYPCVKYYRICF